MIVLDASVLIAHLDARDTLHEQATQALESTGAQQLAASVVTLAEVLVGPARAGRLDDTHNALRELEVRELALPSDAAQTLATLHARTNLRLPDLLRFARSAARASTTTYVRQPTAQVHGAGRSRRGRRLMGPGIMRRDAPDIRHARGAGDHWALGGMWRRRSDTGNGDGRADSG